MLIFGILTITVVTIIIVTLWITRRAVETHRYPLPPPGKVISGHALKERILSTHPDNQPVRHTEDGKRFAEIIASNCPHCKKQKVNFFAGPQGGMSQNIQCENCGWWFNVTVFGWSDDGIVEGIAQDIGFKSKDDDKLGGH